MYYVLYMVRKEVSMCLGYFFGHESGNRVETGTIPTRGEISKVAKLLGPDR